VVNHGITKDISVGGVCVSLYNALEEHLRDKDAVYKIQLRLPHMAEPLHVECKLAWVRKLVHTIQVALVFINMSQTDLQAIQAYCC
jgi:c-di-GMP-binding flagellar brake protein YcgR